MDGAAYRILTVHRSLTIPEIIRGCLRRAVGDDFGWFVTVTVNDAVSVFVGHLAIALRIAEA